MTTWTPEARAARLREIDRDIARSRPGTRPETIRTAWGGEPLNAQERRLLGVDVAEAQAAEDRRRLAETADILGEPIDPALARLMGLED